MMTRRVPDEFLVAFSFAGEQRTRVRSIAKAIERELGRGTVFFDEWFEAYLAGDGGDIKLQDIFSDGCTLVVVCISGEFGSKPWTLAEHAAIRARVMQARAAREESESHSILPIRVGSGDVRGILFGDIVPDVRRRSVAGTVQLIIQRLRLIETASKPGSAVGSKRSRSNRELSKNTPSIRIPRDQKLSVFFVGAERGTGLDLHFQLRQMQKAIEAARLSSEVQLISAFNLTPDELLMRISGSAPDVLHLSGKQEGGLIKMHDSAGKLAPISADRLADALLHSKERNLRLVILDTCCSLQQARRLAGRIDCAIGVAGGIAEITAINFFAMFYNALASGRSIHQSHAVAYQLELSKMEGDSNYRRNVENQLEEPFRAKLHLPRLACRRGVDLKKTTMLGSGRKET